MDCLKRQHGWNRMSDVLDIDIVSSLRDSMLSRPKPRVSPLSLPTSFVCPGAGRPNACPVGTNENSPAIYRWDQVRHQPHLRPVRTLGGPACRKVFNRPCGTRGSLVSLDPAMNCWATITRPYGTCHLLGRNHTRGGHLLWRVSGPHKNQAPTGRDNEEY